MNLYNIEELLVRANPHWSGARNAQLGFRRDIATVFLEELTQTKLILAINGPRRSGKSFLMQQGIDYLIDQAKISPHNICYFQFTNTLNEKNIVNATIDLFLQKYAKDGQKYIFLDEVQYIDFWQDQIKIAYDLLKDVKFIISGSTSLFYHQKSKESLAGRIYKINLGALSFGEYLRFRGIIPPSHDRASLIANLPIYQTEFRKYLHSGQYPEIVANPSIDVQKYIADLIDQIINFDVIYLSSKIDRQLLLNLIKTISFDLADEFSISNLSKVLEADRRDLAKYFQILQELNMFSICYNSAFKSMRKKLIGSKKIYSLNLNMSLHINHFDVSYLNDSRVYGKVVENYVYMMLHRQQTDVEYYRLAGKEIDFVTKDQSFEVKSGQKFDIAKYQILSERLGKKLSILTQEDIFLL